MVNGDSHESANRRTFIKGLGVGGLAAIAGCLGGSDEDGGEREETQFNLDEIEPDGLVGEGPFGEDPSSADEVELSEEEEEEIQNGDHTVEVVFHFREDTWTVLQEEAITNRCSELNIEITGIQYAEFDPETQSNILELIAQQERVDGIFSIPVDIEATTDAYQAVADAGKEIVFMDNVPVNFNHPDDYAGVVAADNRGMGVIGGRMIQELLDGGKVMLLEHDTPFYVTNERFIGARNVLEDNEFELETVGFIEPGDALGIAQDALTANPDTDALWAPWVDPPGAQAIQAIEEQGMDIPVTSCDLGERSGILLAEGEYLKGVGSQNPLAQGQAEVNMMAKRFLGEETPPYVALPSPAVTRENLLEKYPELMGEDPPEDITQHYD